MTRLDDRLVPRAKTLVDKYGKEAIFIEEVAPGFNPSTGKRYNQGTIQRTHKVTPPSPYDRRMIDGDLVKADDLRVFLPASELSFTPVEGMEVIIDDDHRRIHRINKVLTGEKIALYELQLR